MPFAIGQNVGPYRIIEQLGQGGMATVYKAYHAALDRFVALKVLHPAFREDASFLARFTREARVVAKLEHPHIVPIFDYSECDGQPYLVMKFIEGETLKARLLRSPLSAEEAITIVEAVGSALSYAHSKGILHRDIKPSNILLTPDGNIFLADFGLARIAQSGEATLSSDMMVGTPHYISPEQAQGLKDLDAGTDIYSFGVVIYELAVGRVPFNADTPFSIIHDHIFTPLPLPRSINPNVPEGVERVLLKALAKERKDRFTTVDDLVTAFVSATRAVLRTNTAAKAQVHTTPAANIPAATGQTKPANVSAETEKKPTPSKKANARKKFPWWGWVLLAMASCVCLGLIVLAFGRIANQQNRQATETAAAISPAITMTSAPSETAMTSTQEVTATPEAAAIEEFTPPADLLDAWKHLLAGLSEYNANNKDAAAKEFQTALDLTASSRTVFIIRAAQKLEQAGDWSMASSFCVKGLDSKPADRDLNLVSDQALYMLAGESDENGILKQFVADHPELAIANVSYARWLIVHMLNSDNSDKDHYLSLARSDQFYDGKINFVIKAVLGEYMLYKSDTKNGIDMLNSVIQDPNSPAWLKPEAQEIINDPKWKQ